jgi:hypothetical protein
MIYAPRASDHAGTTMMSSAPAWKRRVSGSPPNSSATPPATADRHGWLRAVVVLLAVLLAYGGTAVIVGHTSSPDSAFFDQLADAFLHGRLYLENPPITGDLTLHEGHWYVPFPPLGAALLLPWVALFGVAHTSTVFFSIVWGSLSVAILSRILDGLASRGWIRLDVGGRCWLLLLFALGCVHWQATTAGSVWFLSHTCTVLFIALAVWAAIARRSPWWSGAALAIAMWGRPHVVLTWPLLLGIAAQHLRDAGFADRRSLIGWAWRSVVPLAISVVGLASYNYARFGDPLDFGYKTQNVSGIARENLAIGQFHPHHVLRNLYVMLLGPPRWYEPDKLPAPKGWHLPIPDSRGMSIFLTTPALFYLVRARRRELFVYAAWLSVGLLLIPLLLYYTTGWRTFGYRFSLDFMIPVMVLLAVAAGRRVTWPMRGLILVGVLINAWGAIWWNTNWLD